MAVCRPKFSLPFGAQAGEAFAASVLVDSGVAGRGFDLAVAELFSVELGVGAARCKQLVVRTRLDDAAMVDHMNDAAAWIVESRCATAMVVRPLTSSFSAAWIRRSDAVSSAEVASSSTSTCGSWRSTRAMAMRWRSPPDSRKPRSPTVVS